MTGLLLAALLSTQTPAAPQADAPKPAEAAKPAPEVPPLPPLLAAQVEAHQLRTQLYLQQLQIERERLSAAIAAAVPGYQVDWQTWRLVPIPPKAAEGKDPQR